MCLTLGREGTAWAGTVTTMPTAHRSTTSPHLHSHLNFQICYPSLTNDMVGWLSRLLGWLRRVYGTYTPFHLLVRFIINNNSLQRRYYATILFLRRSSQVDIPIVTQHTGPANPIPVNSIHATDLPSNFCYRRPNPH